MTITVHRAERRKAKLRLAISGPAGSGKTYGALLLAKGLVGQNGKILLVDTERGSGNLYGKMMEYDVADIDPPYLTEKYIEAIKYAEDNGYDCVILDSISHAWNGQGGLLEQNSELAALGNNSFTSWAKITPKQYQFVDAMLNSKIHVIATMRSKTEYAMVSGDNGKMKPEKRGSAPIQREGIDYEFTIVFDVSPSHLAEATKDRSGMFAGEIFTIDGSIGERLKSWLEDGTDAPAPVSTPAPSNPVKQVPLAEKKQFPKNPYMKSQVDSIRAKYTEKGWSTKALDEAQFDAATWDGDAINADFKKRQDAEKKTSAPAPVKETPKPVSAPAVDEPASVCPVCGKPSMTADEAKQLECLADTKIFDHALCKDCATKWWQESEERKAALEQRMPKCIDCGKPITEPDAISSSKERYDVPLCRDCMTKRIAEDMAAKRKKTEIEEKATYPAKQEKTTEMSADQKKAVADLAKAAASGKATEKHTCYRCGAEMTDAEYNLRRIFFPPNKVICKKCSDAEEAAKSKTES